MNEREFTEEPHTHIDGLKMRARIGPGHPRQDAQDSDRRHHASGRRAGAYTANISAQSASAHLTKLVDGGLLVAEAQGRHRYFRLANALVADAIESLGSLSVAVQPRAPRSPLPSKLVPIQFLRARTCYDHLAGEMAIQVCEAMLKAKWLAQEKRDFHVTRLGEKALAALDIDAARRSRRVFARARGPDPAASPRRRRCGRRTARFLRRAVLDPAHAPLARRHHHTQRTGSLPADFRNKLSSKLTYRNRQNQDCRYDDAG